MPSFALLLPICTSAYLPTTWISLPAPLRSSFFRPSPLSLNYRLLTRLKGLCHQIRKAWKWYNFKRLDMAIRRLILKIFSNLPLIFNRHFNCLWWCLKSVQIFYLFHILFEAVLNVFKLHYASWNSNFGSKRLFLIGCFISRIFFNHCNICILKVAGAALFKSWIQIEENSLLNLY